MTPKAIVHKIREWRKDTKQGYGEAVALLSQIETALDELVKEQEAKVENI